MRRRGKHLFVVLPLWIMAVEAVSPLQQLQDHVNYEILVKDKLPKMDPEIISYRISADRFLRREEFEKIICEVVEKDESQKYKILQIYFYYQLKTFFADISDDARNREVRNRAMAAYFWNLELRNNCYALQIYKDELGEEFPGGTQYFCFDHFRDCESLKRRNR